MTQPCQRPDNAITRAAALLAAAGIATLAITATATAATPAPSGIEHWTVESTSSGTYKVNGGTGRLPPNQ